MSEISQSLRDQTAKHFRARLEQFCYEFYEYLDIDEEITVADIAKSVVAGLNDFHASISGETIENQISESNDELEPIEYDDEGYEKK